MSQQTEDVIRALRISDINIQDVVVGPKKRGSKTVLKYNNKPLIFQIPFLEVRGGLRETVHPGLYQLDTMFKGDSKTKIQQFVDFIENIENEIVEQVSNVGTEWFESDTINIKSLIRETENNDLFIRWTIHVKQGIFIDENRNDIDPHSIKPHDRVKLIVEIAGLWISTNTFGIIIIVQKALVKQYVPKIQSDYMFEDSPDSDVESEDNKDNIISLLATEQNIEPCIHKNKPMQTSINSSTIDKNNVKYTSPTLSETILPSPNQPPYTGLHIEPMKTGYDKKMLAKNIEICQNRLDRNSSNDSNDVDEINKLKEEPKIDLPLFKNEDEPVVEPLNFNKNSLLMKVNPRAPYRTKRVETQYNSKDELFEF